MKKIFLAVAAMAMLATACTKDDAVSGGNESLVSFTIDSPELQTRYGEGVSTNRLVYAFYDEAGNHLQELDGSVENYKTKTTIKVYLVEGRKYQAIFWADNTAAGYAVNFATKTMTINDTTLDGNSEEYDAFYNYTLNIDPADKTHTIELRRPFAQINIATKDTAAAKAAGVDVKATKVEVEAYKTLTFGTEVDTTTGEVVPVAKVSNKDSFTYDWAPKAEGKAMTDYDMLSMNYVLVNARELVNVSLRMSEDAAQTADAATDLTREYTTVPVQRNYRTYIVGNLLTTSNDFEVETKPGFEDDDKYGVIDGQTFIRVNSVEEFNAAFADSNYDLIILDSDIVLSESVTRAADATMTVSKGKTLTIDLNGMKLSATSTQTGKNYNMFDVNGGTLTVKNGTIEYKHEGENMNWNNSTNLFNVTAGGVLNLNGVTAKNLGGSDMGFVAHLNNWGEVTLNVENSTLESNYVAVRVFNSGNDMNNVTIKNSTLKGGSAAFWVHNYTAADFSNSQAEADAHKALLNFDIFNGTNTFEPTVRFGMNNSYRYTVVNTAEELAAAFANGGAYALNNNIETATLSLANGKDVVLNLAGNTLSGVDEGTASYGLINNRGNLTINDIKGTGKIQLSATQNRGWNAYSSVISNNPGGVLVVNDGIIEHLGGTDMAYGIDNLTNGKGTSAVATINGGVVKSTYRAIRQFLNGIEATNSLTVNGGVIEGANKSIWMQDPSKNANTGSLTVAATAQLKGDVYLFVTAGSKEWPVEVSVASAALVGESTVLTGNVPVQYEVVEENGTWVVKQTEGTVVYNAEELTAALANAKVLTIILADGEFGTIVMKSDKTIIAKSAGAKVDCVNLNGADNVILKGITFDAATAKMAYDGAGNTRFNALILSGAESKNAEGSNNIVIDGCTFTGTYASGGTTIAFNDQSRGSGQSGNITIKNCTFATEGGYVDIYTYYSGKENMVIENNTFKSAVIDRPIYLGRYQSSTPVVVKGNKFEKVATFAAATYLQAHSSAYTVSFNESGNTFAN